MGCVLNDDILDTLWTIAFALDLLGFVYCAVRLTMGVSRGSGRIRWRKLWKNTVFQVVLSCTLLNGSLTIYAGIRLFAHLYYLHSYIGVIFFILPWGCLVWILSGATGHMLRKMLKALVRATGIRGFHTDNRPWWTTSVVNAGSFALSLPAFAGPSLGPAGRLILMRYWLISLALLSAVQATFNGLATERAVRVLASVGSAATEPARKKLRASNYWTALFCLPLLSALMVLGVTDEVVHAPYFVPFSAIFLGVCVLPTVWGLSFDGSKFRKQGPKGGPDGGNTPSSTADDRASHQREASSPSSSSSSSSAAAGSSPSIPPSTNSPRSMK